MLCTIGHPGITLSWLELEARLTAAGYEVCGRKWSLKLCHDPPEAGAKANASNRKLAASFAANVLPIIRQIEAAGTCAVSQDRT